MEGAGPRTKLILVVALGASQIVAFASSFHLMGGLSGPIAEGLGLRPGFVASFMSLSLLVSAVVAPPVGRWLDRSGGKPVLLTAFVVMAAGLSILACANGPALLALGMAVIGLGMGLGLYDTPFAILVNLYGHEARRSITGVALLGGLGSSIGWPLSLAMSEAFGWRGACLGWAAINLLVVLPVLAVIVPSAPPRAHAGAEPAGRVAWDRPMVQLGVLFSGAWFVAACLSAQLPRTLQAVGLTPTAAVAAASLMGIASVSMRILEFVFLHRLHPLLATRTATLLHPATAAAALAAGAPAGGLVALGQGAANGVLSVAKGALPLAIWGPKNYAIRSAMLSTPARFAQVVGPAVFGLLLDRSVTVAFAATGAICLVMFAMTFGLVADQRRSLEPA